MKDKIVLAVGSHPDDIDFSAAGTIAKWVAGGASAYYLICTNGNKGSNDPKITLEKLAKIRRDEQIEAAKILKVKDVFFLNYNDCELQVSPKLVGQIVKIIRQVRPNVVITFDPISRYSQSSGYINHPDHLACGEATMTAIYPCARDRLTFPEQIKQGLAPHKVEEVYLINFDQQDTYINIDSTFDLKIAALKVHQSQVTEDTINMIRGWAKDAGKVKGYKFAEGFKKIKISF